MANTRLPASLPPTSRPRRARGQSLAELALVLPLLLLIVLGGLVRATGGGLACPDWPLCYGQLIPPLDDYKAWLEKLAPFNPDPKVYRHNHTGEDNADAHLKRQVMGREVVVAVTGGRLDFGPWEQIFYGEFDGDRPKRVLVKVIGE